MNRIVICLILTLNLVSFTNVFGVEQAYREVQTSFAFGAVFPTGDWTSQMENGQGISIDLGMAISPQLTGGMHFSLGIMNTKFEQIGPQEAYTSNNDWTRYTGGPFVEYRLTASDFAPYVGANLGVHAVHVSYVETIEGIDGLGDYGFGFGVTVGLRYRVGPRFGAVLRFDAENSPDMTSGWFYQTRLGLALFL